MDKEKLNQIQINIRLSIKEVIRKLNETNEHILFIVDSNKKLLGTVIDGDVRRGIIKGYDFSVSVEKIMNKNFVFLSHDNKELSIEAKRKMLEARVEKIPVINNNREILDVISWADILGEKELIKTTKTYPNHVIIMAGGKGTRLGPFTKVLPKPLIPIGEKPIVEHIMERFYQHGFKNFIYTLNYKKQYVKLFLKESNYPYNIDWVEEDKYLGTAGSISLLKEKVSDTFFVANCDSLLDINFEEVVEWHKEHKASMTIVGCHNEVTIPFGVLELSNGSFNKMLEKPVHDVIINTGVYVLEPHLISYIKKGKYLDMNELIEMVNKNEKVSVFLISNGWIDVGQWEEYEENIKQFQLSRKT